MNDATQQSIDDQICGELGKIWILLTKCAVARNKQLDEIAMTLDAPAKIQIRVQQLALCKLLVNVHKKDLFILVTAFTQLGEAYLRANYFEQALDHLTTALKLNGSLFSQIADTKQYHS